MFFHLDPLWADANIDFVGIDNYMPLSDWRDGWAHADALEWPSVYDRAYLQSNIAGGEGFDWFYASDHDRAAQIRTPITDGSAGKPWVFRPKDLRSWWSNPHYDRPGGSEVTESEPNRVPNPTGTGAVTGVPGSLPDNWSQVDGTGLTREVVAAGQGDLDLRFSGVITSGSLGVQIQFGPGGSIPVTLGEVLTFGVDLALIAGSFANVWEVRHSVSERNAGGSSLGFYNGPDLRPAITVTPSRQVFAHEITDPAAATLLLRIDFRISGVVDFTIRIANPSLKRSPTRTAWLPQSKPIRFTELGCPAVDRGTNQPNVFHDPKSSESFFPCFSRGWRDDAIQRAYLEATYPFWRDPANNPVSPAYAGPMVDVANCAAWTWDARPYPFFPELSDVWSDGDNWRLGHWLTGRLGAVSLAALARHLCRRSGLREEWIDVSGLTGVADGYVVTALESTRASITMLARHFGFDAVESGGVLRFVMRGRAPVAVIAPEDMVAAGQSGGDIIELTRGQETELPQALKWQVARADEDYDPITVEARRITVDATRIGSDSFAIAVPPEEADRRCRRALMEAWIGRETGAFRLPPSKLALDPGDVIALEHDGRRLDYRILSTADGEARTIEAIRQDRDAFDLPPGAPRPTTLAQPVVFGAPLALMLDLPQLSETHPPHQPLVAAHAVPWPGEMAVYRSPEASGFELLTTFSGRVRMGMLTADLYAGPISRFDHGNAVYLELMAGTLESITDLALFAGANALVVAQPAGGWEVLQFATAELISPNRYRLSRLLRGQRGSDADMAPMVPAGARVVMLDSMLAPLPIGAADLGLPWNWRIGPASNPVSDDSFTALSFAPEGIGLRPFAPVHVEQPWRRARVPGDLILRWTRRDRSLAADSWSAAEVPMSEAAEAWQVEILDGATVKRVLSSSTTSVLYGAVQQGEDWGGPLGPGHSLTVRIAQLGQAFGHGAATITTLWF